VKPIVVAVPVRIVESPAGGDDAAQSGGTAAAAIGGAIGGLAALVSLAVLYFLFKKKTKMTSDAIAADGEIAIAVETGLSEDNAGGKGQNRIELGQLELEE
jgi:hypothetical protein